MYESNAVACSHPTSTPNAVETRQPQVVEEFESLENQISRLEEIAGNLSSRLSGVLRNEPEAASGGQAKDPITLVAAAQRVRASTERLAQLGDFYSSISRRLEI